MVAKGFPLYRPAVNTSKLLFVLFVYVIDSMGIVKSDVRHLPIKYIIQYYTSIISIFVSICKSTALAICARRNVVDVVEEQFFLSKFRSRWPHRRPGSRTKDAIVESSTSYRIAVVIQKTYPEYAQSPGHTRLHDIKVSASRMCPELRANM